MTERLTRVQQQEVTRTRLLDAAETLFGDRGIHRTSLDEIAAAAGLTKGAIYANFGSKRDLIAAILERKLASDEAPEPHQSVAGWVRSLGESYESNLGDADVRRFALAFLEFALHGMREPDNRAAVARWLRTVRELNGKEAAELAGGDLTMPVDRLAALMTALDIGVAVQHLLDPEAVPADVYAAGLEALLVRRPGAAGSR